MPFVPHTFVLFMYNPMNGIHQYINASYNETHLIDYVDKCDDTMYYCIYQYIGDAFYFGSTQKALRYMYHRKLAGIKNDKTFHYSPMEYAVKFANENSWFYQSS